MSDTQPQNEGMPHINADMPIMEFTRLVEDTLHIGLGGSITECLDQFKKLAVAANEHDDFVKILGGTRSVWIFVFVQQRRAFDAIELLDELSQTAPKVFNAIYNRLQLEHHSPRYGFLFVRPQETFGGQGPGPAPAAG